jgi:RNA polymerase sigma factor (sigma-70 family)
MSVDSSKEQVFEEVRESCAGLISRVALVYEADPSLRRELVQDILLAVWSALPSFRYESSLRTFVAAIAQKRAISHVAKRAREPRQVELPADLVSAALSPDEAAVRNDLRKQLVESIHLLSIPQREAIVLCFEGFSYSEVGMVLGISTNAATLRCQRAKHSLRSIIERRA